MQCSLLPISQGGVISKPYTDHVYASDKSTISDTKTPTYSVPTGPWPGVAGVDHLYVYIYTYIYIHTLGSLIIHELNRHQPDIIVFSPMRFWYWYIYIYIYYMYSSHMSNVKYYWARWAHTGGDHIWSFSKACSNECVAREWAHNAHRFGARKEYLLRESLEVKKTMDSKL